MKSYRTVRIIVAMVAAVAVVWILQTDDDAPTPSTTEDAQLSAEPATSAEAGTDPAVQQPSMIVHIDPVTGEPLETPPPGSELEPVSKQSSEGLVAQPSPGGGMMVDLEGRYQQSAQVSLGDSDSVKIDCVPEEGEAESTTGSGSDGGK